MTCKACSLEIPLGDGYCDAHGGSARKDRELADEAAEIKCAIEARRRARTPNGILPPPRKARFFRAQVYLSPRYKKVS